MKDDAPGLSISEPGNMGAPLPSGERGAGGGRLEIGWSIARLPLMLFTW